MPESSKETESTSFWMDASGAISMLRVLILMRLIVISRTMSSCAARHNPDAVDNNVRSSRNFFMLRMFFLIPQQI